MNHEKPSFVLLVRDVQETSKTYSLFLLPFFTLWDGRQIPIAEDTHVLQKQGPETRRLEFTWKPFPEDYLS